MDRSIPMFNRVVVEKMQRKNLDLHHQRLERIKTNPIRRQQMHSVLKVDNAKGSQLQEQRRTQIEKQNVILFNKMNRIMNRSHTKVNCSLSLHKDTRHRQMNDRIYQENKSIVQRIGNQRPTISVKKLHQDRQKHERLLRFMGKYPYRTNYISKVQDSQDHNFERGNSYYGDTYAYEESPSENQLQNSSFNKTRTASNTVTRQQSRRPTRQTTEYQQKATHESDRDQSHRIPLYKKRKQINNILYQVEVNRLYKEYEFRLTDLISKKQYILYMPEKEGNQLLSESDYDYSYLTNCFRVVGNKLVLDLNTPKDVVKEKHIHAEMSKGPGEARHNLFNQNKLKNFRLKEQSADNEANRTDLRNSTEDNNQPPFGFVEFGTFHQSDTLDPNTCLPSQDRARILYEEALDQELQQI